jgi:hypothetical protein
MQRSYLLGNPQKNIETMNIYIYIYICTLEDLVQLWRLHMWELDTHEIEKGSKRLSVAFPGC